MGLLRILRCPRRSTLHMNPLCHRPPALPPPESLEFLAMWAPGAVMAVRVETLKVLLTARDSGMLDEVLASRLLRAR